MVDTFPQRLADWAVIFRAIGSLPTAELLCDAATTIAEGRKDSALATQLLESAESQVFHDQAAAILRQAAAVLSAPAGPPP